MGFTRKMMSVSTGGLVDFRSDKERTAAYTRGAKRQAKKQTGLMREQARAQEQYQRQMLAAQQQAAQGMQQPVQQHAPSAPPPGFYNDPGGQQLLRWWDGLQWTAMTQPLR